MSLTRRARTMGFVLCAGQLAAGCGEDTPDRLSFGLPPTTIDISSDNPQWRSAPATAVPAMVCAGPRALGSDCCAPPPGVPATGVDCAQYPVACDPSNNLCALTFDVENQAVVDLVARVAEVAAADGRVWSRVELSALSTWVEEPDALPIRNANLFVGPRDAASSSSPGVALLGPVALTEESTPIRPDAEALATFARLARDYRMPFVLWVAAHLVVPGGNPPTGRVAIHVEGRVQAWY